MYSSTPNSWGIPEGNVTIACRCQSQKHVYIDLRFRISQTFSMGQSSVKKRSAHHLSARGKNVNVKMTKVLPVWVENTPLPFNHALTDCTADPLVFSLLFFPWDTQHKSYRHFISCTTLGPLWSLFMMDRSYKLWFLHQQISKARCKS